MKKILLILLVALPKLKVVHSQTAERSLAAGFSTTASLVKSYGYDKWLLAGRGEPELGAYYQDTLFVAVIGNGGQIYLRKNLTTPVEEVHFFHDVLALPDGGIVVSFESTLCDVGGFRLTTQRLDEQGNMMWELDGGFVFGETRPPEKWFVAADGNLIGAAYNQVWKVDAGSGDILWKADMQGIGGGDTSFYEIVMIPGSEDFFALGNPTFQRWKKAGDPNAPFYTLVGSMNVPGVRRSLTYSPNETFYCWQAFPDKQIERVDLNFQVEVLPIQLVNYGTKSMAIGEQGLYLAESSSGTHKITRFDLDGQNPNIMHSSYWLNPLSIAVQDGWVAVVGQDGSGVPNWSSHNNTCTGAWLRTFPESDPFPPAATPDISVVGIQQIEPMDTVSLPNFPIGTVYNLSGGDFQVKVKNSNIILLQEVCVNVVFDFNEFYDFCPNKPSKQVKFTNLNLSFGESTWLHFDDISAQGQNNVPGEICFWTSSPNEQPDLFHEDDRFCTPVSYTVAVKNPDIVQVAVSPNPADDFAEITFLESMEGETWQIFDATGRLATKGVCSNSLKIQVETAQLTNGFYWLSLKNQVGKLVVQH